MQTAKSEYIKDVFIKEQLEKEELNEIEYYAEQYINDLPQQFLDNNDLEHNSKRLKNYQAESFDLDMEMNELNSIKTFITDNTHYNLEKQSEILMFIDSKIAEITDRVEIVEGELSYITTRIKTEKVV